MYLFSLPFGGVGGGFFKRNAVLSQQGMFRQYANRLSTIIF